MISGGGSSVSDLLFVFELNIASILLEEVTKHLDLTEP
jgi:hypothetical protein